MRVVEPNFTELEEVFFATAANIAYVSEETYKVPAFEPVEVMRENEFTIWHKLWCDMYGLNVRSALK